MALLQRDVDVHFSSSSDGEQSGAASHDSDVIFVGHSPVPKQQNSGSAAQRPGPQIGLRPLRAPPCSSCDCVLVPSCSSCNCVLVPSTVIQRRLHSACAQSSRRELNELLRCSAAHGDARATVHVFDLLGAGAVDAAGWEALRTLEQQRACREVFAVPAAARAQLAPLRRIHKICKGPRLHERSEMAKRVMPRVLEWLEARAGCGRNAVSNAARLCGKRRRAQADVLRKELGLRVACARGVVTKLKQKKVIW
jgi:hypothetical protein